jgi:hypothetical protein
LRRHSAALCKQLIFWALLMACLPAFSAAEWNRDFYYDKGAVVTFLGSEFTAQSGNRNVEPTLSSEIWKKSGQVIGPSLLNNIPLWSSGTMYDIPQITVAHKGKLWRNTSGP